MMAKAAAVLATIALAGATLAATPSPRVLSLAPHDTNVRDFGSPIEPPIMTRVAPSQHHNQPVKNYPQKKKKKVPARPMSHRPEGHDMGDVPVERD
jgi:hypothetical protein